MAFFAFLSSFSMHYFFPPRFFFILFWVYKDILGNYLLDGKKKKKKQVWELDTLFVYVSFLIGVLRFAGIRIALGMDWHGTNGMGRIISPIQNFLYD